MKLFKRDIPPRAAIAVVGLVLIASIVNGREQEPEVPVQAPVARAAQGAAPADTLANLDIERLKRSAQAESVTDVLAHRSLLPAAPVEQNTAEPGAAAAPAAPALPFTYLGRLVDGGTTTIFVGRGAEHYILERGMKIDASYQVERITDKQVTFVYLPLGTRQTLAVPSLDE